jgi:cytochrome d ubiquinol oxidase subunit II
MYMMLVLLGLIVRAVSIEFRYLSESPAWKRRVDLMFAIGSIIPALLFGVVMGNIALGLPLDSNLNYTGGLLSLLNPYALLLGLLGLCAFVLQGNTYIILKNTGALQENAKAILPKVWLAFIILYVIASHRQLSGGSRLVRELYPSWLDVPGASASGV